MYYIGQSYLIINQINVLNEIRVLHSLHQLNKRGDRNYRAPHFAKIQCDFCQPLGTYRAVNIHVSHSLKTHPSNESAYNQFACTIREWRGRSHGQHGGHTCSIASSCMSHVVVIEHLGQKIFCSNYYNFVCDISG